MFINAQEASNISMNAQIVIAESARKMVTTKIRDLASKGKKVAVFNPEIELNMTWEQSVILAKEMQENGFRVDNWRDCEGPCLKITWR